jgi:hypothetical protein
MAVGTAVAPGVGTAIGGIMGLAGGILSGKKESEAEAQQRAALAADQAKRDAFTAKQEAVFGPIETNLAHEAASPLPMNYGANLGAINTQAQQAQQHLGGQMARLGMTGSGAEAAGLQGIEHGRVGELSQAFNTGLQARNKLGMDLLQRYNPLGNTQLQTGALPQAMSFGANQQKLAVGGMEQGFGAFGKGVAGVLNGLNKPGAPNATDPTQTSDYANNNSNSIADQLNQLSPGFSPTGYNTGSSPMDLGYTGMGFTGMPSAQSQEFPAGWDMSQTGGAAAPQMSQVPAETGGGLNLWNPFAVAGDT